MSTQHTPGPWRVTGGMPLKIQDAQGVVVAAPLANTDMSVETYRANAALIALAPELFKALEPFAAWLDHPSVPIASAIRPEEWDAVRAVYAKAKGT